MKRKYEGMHILEDCFENNEEIFIIIEIQDKKRTTLKGKVKLTSFEVQSEANNKSSVNISCEKIGNAKEIQSLEPEEKE